MYKNSKSPRLPTLLVSLVLGLGLNSLQAQAEYQDAVELPSLSKSSVQQSLLLDVTLAGARQLAVGERGHILYSDDHGSSWQQAQVGTRAQLNAVIFADSQTGWAVGEDQVIVKTIDGGLNWQRVHDGRDADQKGPLLDLYFKDAQQGFAIGVFNKLLHTQDGGQSWQPWQDHIDNLDEWHLFALAAASEQHLYIASEMGLLFRSLDGGQSFEPIQTDHDGSFQGVLARQDAQGTDQLVLFGVGGVIYSSTDGGESWHWVDSGMEVGLSAGTWLDDGRALLVGADGAVLVLDAELKQARLHSLENGLPISSIAVADGQVTLVGLGGLQSLPLQQLAGGQ